MIVKESFYYGWKLIGPWFRTVVFREGLCQCLKFNSLTGEYLTSFPAGI